MAGREVGKSKLELTLVVASKWDILKKEFAGADKKNAVKMGEMDVEEYMIEGVRGEVFLKRVYDDKGKVKDCYFSDSRELIGGEESLNLKRSVGVPEAEYVYIGNKREIDNG